MLIRVFLAAGVLLFGALSVAGYLFGFLWTPYHGHSPVTEIEIRKGESLASITQELAGKGVISQWRPLVLWAQLRGVDKKVQPGLYRFEGVVTPAAVLARLVDGRSVHYKVTVPEGLTVRQIADLFERESRVSSAKFVAAANSPVLRAPLAVDSLEGYLFPATYKLPAVTTEEQIVATMLATFERRFTPEMEARGRDIGMTRHQVVTLASIIEKEGGPHDEWAMVSAVFHNRLKRGMRLQSDPTVIYGLEDFNGNLTRRDLRTPTPYNTYRIAGLPPGPIANPGLAAINAALFPAAVDYLYFVSKNDGSHHFSVTLREHNKAVDRYQRNGRARSRKVASP